MARRARANALSGTLNPLAAGAAAAAGAFALGLVAGRRRPCAPRIAAVTAPAAAHGREDGACCPGGCGSDGCGARAASSSASSASVPRNSAGSGPPSSVSSSCAPETSRAVAAAAAAVPGLPAAALDCPVCLAELLLPRVAPCGHSLCTPCLVALHAHERRPACPVCRARMRVPVDRLPVNFALKALVEARVSTRGPSAWDAYCGAEEDARATVAPCSVDLSAYGGGASSAGRGGTYGGTGSSAQHNRRGSHSRRLFTHLRPAWNWCKWSVIIVTELCAFLVSLKEVIEATPNRTRRYQRIV